MDRKVTLIIVAVIVLIVITIASSLSILELLDRNVASEKEVETTPVETVLPTTSPITLPEEDASDSGTMKENSQPTNRIESVEVDWDFFVDTLKNCQAVSLFQAHDLTVQAELDGGLTIISTEPQIDDIADVYVDVQDKCGSIPFATE